MENKLQRLENEVDEMQDSFEKRLVAEKEILIKEIEANKDLRERLARLVEEVNAVADSLFPGPLRARPKAAIAAAKETK